jgi:allantoin racemase
VLKRVVAVSRAALDRDDSDVIVLGCAGMADLCAAASAELGVPVIDGVAAATLLVESLIRLSLQTSTRGEYAPPPPKHYTGLLAEFERRPTSTD